MRIQKFNLIALLSVTSLLQGCFADDSNNRWYSAEQAQRGLEIFQKNCASCHGTTGASVETWRQKQANGYYPPPPLDGSAHSWHHPMPFLKYQIANGGLANGGYMPAFGNALSEQEIEDVIAGFQSFWNDEIYEVWSTKVNK